MQSYGQTCNPSHKRTSELMLQSIHFLCCLEANISARLANLAIYGNEWERARVEKAVRYITLMLWFSPAEDHIYCAPVCSCENSRLLRILKINKLLISTRISGMAKTRASGDDEVVQPRNIQRADIGPSTGFALVVDGRIKTKYDDRGAANKAAEELLSRFPMLQIQIYDAANKTRIPLHSASDVS